MGEDKIITVRLDVVSLFCVSVRRTCALPHVPFPEERNVAYGELELLSVGSRCLA
jgi:hypothetical protein